MSEVRPWIGSLVSLALFKIVRPLKIIDCTRGHSKRPLFLSEPAAERREAAVWAHIDRAFSEPTTRMEDRADYAPTQVLAEMFRENGHDGVAYKSSFGIDDGYNVALFDLNAAECVNRTLYSVKRAKFEFKQEDDTQW